jgi:DNA-binding GntR family transcriptional regulator
VLQGWNGSLYSLFETRFGVRMIRAQERIRAVAADRNASEALKRRRGHAAAVGRAGHLHLWRQAGRVASRPVFDRRTFLSE